MVGADTMVDDIKFSDILTVIKKNRPFVALCIHGICICTMQFNKSVHKAEPACCEVS